jgi:GMP synthase-like glutamine amidotransferase
MHRDIVPTYPPHVEWLGHSQHCDVKRLYVKNRLISLQKHPEFNGKIVNKLLDLSRGMVLDEETYQTGKGRSDHAHDGVTVAAGFVRFWPED